MKKILIVLFCGLVIGCSNIEKDLKLEKVKNIKNNEIVLINQNGFISRGFWDDQEDIGKDRLITQTYRDSKKIHWINVKTLRDSKTGEVLGKYKRCRNKIVK